MVARPADAGRAAPSATPGPSQGTRLGPGDVQTRVRRFLDSYGISILAIGAFFALWEVAFWAELLNPIMFRPPTAVFAAGVRLISNGTIVRELGASAQVFAMGFGLSVAVAVPLGLLAGWYKPLYYVLEPYLLVLYATPRVALLPILFIWVGIEAELKIALIALSAYFPMITNVIAGVTSLEAETLRLAKSFGGGRLFLLKSIILPGSVPFIVTALRVGAARALVGLIVAELYASNSGIGYFLTVAATLFQVADLFFATLVVAAIGLGLNALFTLLENSVSRWRVGVGSRSAGI
jgi:NitT/TauT family transport system permease protein